MSPPAKTTGTKPAMYEIPFTDEDNRGIEIQPYLQCDKKNDAFSCGIYADDVRIKPIKERVSSVTSTSVSTVKITNDGDRFIVEPPDYGMQCAVVGKKGEDLRLDCGEI